MRKPLLALFILLALAGAAQKPAKQRGKAPAKPAATQPAAPEPPAAPKTVAPRVDPLDQAIEHARNGKPDEARRLLDAMLKDDPANTRAGAIVAAIDLQSGDAASALARAETLVAAEPGNIDLRELRGQSNMALRRWEAAETDWRWILRQKPDAEQAMMQLAAVLLQRDRFAEALDEITKVIQINPGHSDARALRGNILAATGRIDDAAQDWSVALVKNPKDAVALSGLAVYLVRREPDRALEFAERAVRITGGQSLGPYRVLGLVLRTRGEYEQARLILERAQKQFPDSDLLAADLRAVAAAAAGATAAAARPPAPVQPPPAAVVAAVPAKNTAVKAAERVPASPGPLRFEPVPEASNAARAPAPTAPPVAAPAPSPLSAATMPPAMPIAASIVPMTLGTPAGDLWPMLRMPSAPRTASIAPPERMPRPPARTRTEPPPVILALAAPADGTAVGAPMPELLVMARRPSAPKAAVKKDVRSAAKTAPAPSARASSVKGVPAPDLAFGVLPLSAILTPFVYGDVVLPPAAPSEESLSLGEIARRLKEQRKNQQDRR